MGDRGKEFASIAYTVLVVDRRPGVKAAARLLGMNYSTLHSRLIGRTSFSADEIRDLVRAVPDPRLVSYLLDGSHFIEASRTSRNGHIDTKRSDAGGRGRCRRTRDRRRLDRRRRA
ncbi:hypothetical protein FZ934_19215 (plasmid) [Rhizobium grahamii]|uniref:XRE family transcriptional regulator n=1 Tax=Rhizobium grahamii TaxID=1120045 RepID=A0A5Q0C9E0_9HYPH|nr:MULTISPECIES: hypothetical protein [Rhizobium]QFY62526.1 hypothetical protein FZ934_19215 [Rhizobium grahamii]QRM52733.1 hypothetical protein F3Y33_26445 [Rhizobium sp. BG6]